MSSRHKLDIEDGDRKRERDRRKSRSKSRSPRRNRSRSRDRGWERSRSPNEKPRRSAVEINPFSGQPYTQRYFEIFKKRTTLPVWEYKDKFLEVLDKNQVCFLIGLMLVIIIKKKKKNVLKIVLCLFDCSFI
ncbi:Uncharacterized protein BM_BM4476 [Brugia malayi]|uniref:BMA-DDX-15, isoform c n=1 Tax=Brugia malayi TaxID=6279 RepID=A0A0K0JEU1_BRUMA|nr:Uncharacterized protein BM_BM4476 [Brugia malayi]CDP99737.1 BMA-DDX-15, isoform c [Brugia malayi]VIO91803.1 Uncharacterized protein BM_BM4476 [Brugia malayi]